VSFLLRFTQIPAAKIRNKRKTHQTKRHKMNEDGNDNVNVNVNNNKKQKQKQ